MKQITVLLDNRIGAVAELTRLLAVSNVNIESMCVEACGSSGAAVISVDRYDHSLKVLKEAGYDAISEDALVVRIADEPGALAKVAARFEQGHIDIRGIRFLCRNEGVALAALVTDDNTAAAALVADILVG
jgi:hypothetical protein